MSENLRNYTKAIYTMDAVVQRVPDSVWDQQSPCDQWSAKEVLGHFMWGTQNLTAAASDGTFPDKQTESQVAGSDPKASWAASRDALLTALDHQGALDKNFNGPFGPGTVDSFLAVHAIDCLLHTWDIAKTAGIDSHLPADLAAAGAAGLASLGDGARGPGLFGPAVEVESDDPVANLVAIAGRNPA
ncbi:MAG: TIGR03086 family metal-binding protein [Ilumatobacteraceae bacterium]